MHDRFIGLAVSIGVVCAALAGGCAGVPGHEGRLAGWLGGSGEAQAGSSAQPGENAPAENAAEQPSTPSGQTRLANLGNTGRSGTSVTEAGAQPAGGQAAADLSLQSLGLSAEKPASAEMLRQVMAELQDLGALDPAAQARLLSDMQQTDPSLWPLMVRQFRAALAYRRQSESAGGRISASSPSGPNGMGSRPRQPSATLAAGTAGQQGGQSAQGSIPTSQSSRAEAQVWGSSSAGSNQIHQAAYQAEPPGRLSAEAPPEGSISTRRAAFSGPSAAPGGGPLAAGETAPQVAQVAREQTGRPQQGHETTNVQREWQRHLTAAILALESELQSPGSPAASPTDEARLRMLYLIAGDRQGALRPISGATPAVQDFWVKELYGLGTWLDVERQPDESRRAGEAKQTLTEALARLGELAPLVVRNLTFCTAIQSFGCTTPFSTYEFQPGQPVLLYVEVDNFTSEPTPKGYHTALRSRFRILDAQGRCVEDHDFTVTEEYCANQRRDFFIGYDLTLPEKLSPGRYTLELTVEDLKSKKVGQSSIAFTISSTKE